MKRLLTILFLFFSYNIAIAQDIPNPYIRLIQPYKEKNPVSSSKQYISGNTCKSCTITINDSSVKVYPTGAFVYELNLKAGDTTITFVSTNVENKSATKKISYTYTVAKPAEPVKTLSIASIETFPEGNLEVMAGDRIRFKVKALTGCTVMLSNKVPLYELPLDQTKNMPGIYQGEYIVKEEDSALLSDLSVIVTDKTGKKISKEVNTDISFLATPFIVRTKGRLAHLEYGLGDDRLGGAKIGYLDSLVLLKIIGKVGSDYKVELTKTHTAYIPDDLVTMMPEGTFTPESLTPNKWSVTGDDKYDYVKIPLAARLPYQSFQLTDPSKIIVDIYGATNNTNWITQMLSAKEIKNIYYEQTEDNVFRITIDLKHKQHWGHQLYYNGNTLIIKIKQQPDNLSLKNLVIAIDAGHGGTNNGGVGPTGVYEKDITLAVSLKLQKTLEKEGATVIMTRTKEQFFDNKERILFYRDSMPDLLVSFHLNSSEDPIHVEGTSTYYKYIGYRPLSTAIYKRMLELGLKEYGNTGAFNFMLNSPTEYPNVLVEALFLSNPDEEMKILDDKFQQQVVDKIVAGIKDFLDNTKQGK